MKPKMFVAIIAATGAGAAVTAWSLKPAPPTPIQYAVQSEKVAAPVAAAGRVEPVSEEIKIASELNGRLREVRVEEGDRVRRRQIVAVLENDDFAARVSLAEAQVAQRQAEQLRVRNGSRTEERRAAEAAVAEAKAVLDEAQAEWRRRESLFRSGDIAHAALEKAERELAVAKARLEAAAERRDISNRASREEDFMAAEANLNQAHAQLAEARALLEKTYIRSSIDGVVLRKKAKTGESVSVDNPEGWILTVGDDSALRVRVDVDESDVARVEEGQLAYVTAEAYGTKRFTGRVVRVGQILGRKNIRTDEPTERVDRKILETLVELDRGQKLPAGLRVDAFIQPPR